MAMSWSVPLGSILGIPLRLHLSFLLLLVVQTLAQIPGGKWWVVVWLLAMGPILLATVLIHELGHCLAARQVGGKASGILLWPLGGLAFIHHNASPKADMWVAFAGPLTHVPMIGFWLLMSLASTYVAYGRAFVTLSFPYPEPPYFGVTLTSLALYMNIFIFAFNLLIPAYPLDGGRIFVDSLLACGVVPTAAAKITLGVAVPIAAAILVFGAVFFQPVTIMIALFLFWACWELFDCLRKGLIAQHPLFSFTASQNAAAAAVAGQSLEVGGAGPYGAAPPRPRGAAYAPGGGAAAAPPQGRAPIF
ncbi:MAG: hypothetical protein J3K34DRAFT_252144 [Monoraphidium minutum]|nr:MAG: hypothetical protein J3K34DRAFT_252144 [Monoraphidium minutum]